MTEMLKEIGSIDEGPDETPCGREGASMIIYQRLTLTILRVPFLAPSSCDVTEVGGEDNFHTMHERSETKRAASTEVGWSSRATLVCALTCSKGGDGGFGGFGGAGGLFSRGRLGACEWAGEEARKASDATAGPCKPQ
jgi:hypothetical protein